MPQIHDKDSVPFVSQQGQYAHLINNELESFKFYTLADFDSVFAALRTLQAELGSIQNIEAEYAEFLTKVAPKSQDEIDTTGLAKLLDPELCYVYPEHVLQFIALMQSLITDFMQNRASESQRAEHLHKAPAMKSAKAMGTADLSKSEQVKLQFKAQRNSLKISLNVYYIVMGDQELDLLLRADLVNFLSNPTFTDDDETLKPLNISDDDDRKSIIKMLAPTIAFITEFTKSSLYTTDEFDNCISMIKLLTEDQFSADSIEELNKLLSREQVALCSTFQLFGMHTPKMTDENIARMQMYTAGIRDTLLFTDYSLQELLEMDTATRKYLFKDRASVLRDIKMDLTDRHTVNLYVAWQKLHADICEAEEQNTEPEQSIPIELHERYNALLDQMKISFYTAYNLSDLKYATDWMCKIICNLNIFYNIDLTYFHSMDVNTSQLAATWYDEHLNTYKIRYLTTYIGCNVVDLISLPEAIFKYIAEYFDSIIDCCQQAGIELKRIVELDSFEEIHLILKGKNLQRLKVALGYYCLPAEEFLRLEFEDKRALLAKPSLARKLFDDTAAGNEYSLMLGLSSIKVRLNSILANLERHATLCYLEDLHAIGPELMRVLQSHGVPFYKARVIVHAVHKLNVQLMQIYVNRSAYATNEQATSRCIHDDSEVWRTLESDESRMVNTTLKAYADKLNVILHNTSKIKRSDEFEPIFNAIDFLNSSPSTDDDHVRKLLGHMHNLCGRIQHLCKTLNYGNAALKHLHLLKEVIGCKVAVHFTCSELTWSQDVSIWQQKLDMRPNTDYTTYFPKSEQPTEQGSELQLMFERFFHAVLCLRNTLLPNFTNQLFKTVNLDAEYDYFGSQDEDLKSISTFTLAYRTQYFITPSCTEYSPYAFACLIPGMENTAEQIAYMIRRDTSRMLINFYRAHGLSFNNDYPNMNARDKHGNTALHIAILEENKLIALALILRGCEITAEGADDLTPIQLALRHNQVQIINDLQTAYTAQELRQRRALTCPPQITATR